MLTFIEHHLFTKQIQSLLDDDDYAKLQQNLAANPTAGDLIPGLAGLRKLRFTVRGRGKRGGGRAVYLYLRHQSRIYLFYAFSKGDITDLNADQRKKVVNAVKAIKATHSE